MREASKDGSSVAVSGSNTAPDGSEPLVFLARLGLVDVNDSLAEVVLSSGSIVDTFESEDGLISVLLHLRPSEAEELGSHPKSHLFSRPLSANALGLVVSGNLWH